MEMVLTDVTDAYAVTLRKDCVWMMAKDRNWQDKMFLGDFKAKGDNTAHIQMQEHLPSPEGYQVQCALSFLQ